MREMEKIRDFLISLKNFITEWLLLHFRISHEKCGDCEKPFKRFCQYHREWRESIDSFGGKLLDSLLLFWDLFLKE